MKAILGRSWFNSCADRALPSVAVASGLVVLFTNPQDASAQAAPATAAATAMEAFTVTGTRERALLSETPASVSAIKAETIQQTAPMHPGQILGQFPGVAVAVTNGEGHTTAIRQPFTTSPVYLFLEDGIPVRATGFFNHNALYEVNIPMAGGIEVVRGPGTALYGSDAIGGIVNVLSNVPMPTTEFGLSTEFGSFGVARLMASGGSRLTQEGAFRVDLNLTHNDGWRDRTAYDRQSINFRWDQKINPTTTVKTIFGASKIDQNTGANSALTFADYISNPKRNNFGIAYRKVTAARLSVELEKQFGTGMISLIPYFRDNAMELNASFNLSSDPRIDNGHNVSYGLLSKWRKNFPAFLRARVIGGLDLDYSPGSRKEDNILVSRSGTGANTVYNAYTIGTRIYDYNVTFKSISPYLHTEISPFAKLRVTGGLRFDTLKFDMQNNLSAAAVQASVLGATRYYGQVQSNSVSYDRLSPKIGATYQLNSKLHVYASHNHGFRGPSEGQLYRAGNDTSIPAALAKSQLALRLQPIKADQTEFGLRGESAKWSFSLVGYELTKRNDLVSQRDLATNVTTNVNAGLTRHRGLEAGAGISFLEKWRFDTALSYARHTYVDWVTATANFNGKHIESAPHLIANTRLTWKPIRAAMAQIEWVRLSSYWLEASNSPVFGQYPGHDLLNLRARYILTKSLSLSARVINALDKRFADSASVSSNTPVFTPGLPRAFYGGIEARW